MPRGEQERLTYLTVMGGKVVERLDKSEKRKDAFDDAYMKAKWPDIEVHLREAVDPTTKVFLYTAFERRDDFVEGHIEEAKIRDGNFGGEILITINDGEERFILQIKQDTSIGLMLLKAWPNVNPFKPAKIIPWKSNNGEGITIMQDEVKIKSVWTKEDMGDYPVPPEFALQGHVNNVPYSQWDKKMKHEYDNYKFVRMEFLEKHFKDHSDNFGPYDSFSEEEMEKTSQDNAASRELTEQEIKQGQKPNTIVSTAKGTKEVDSTTMNAPPPPPPPPANLEDDDLPF